MQRCPSCDHFNLADATECERCGRSLASEPAGDVPATPPAGPGPDTFEGRVLDAARQSGKIAAIKLYREQRNGGLKEAKEAVEAMMAEHGVKAGSSGSGWGAAVLAMIAAVAVIVRLVAT